ncbi:amino acid ABC transporter permease [Achromobacter kerstersii]|uniref:amino acid ABC transporter permease n=1 Tax=Achromobacter kerstersii TaxID=1353890 RepID=UPI0006C6511B|nr:amino acid ABC transporter permease [Achromobacter kerstersii]CUJ49077.1 Inner membrane amino-acid ABC transporter permease protein yecS [Achromobacter kerstersii]
MVGLSIEHFQFILRGAGWTLVLSATGFLGGALIGLPLSLVRARSGWLLRSLSGAVIQLVQGIPLPVLMFLCYFGISIAGFNLPSLVAAGLAMTAYSGVFLADIWKACIEAVSRTQWEAAECLALGPVQRFLYVILPQAARIAIAPTVGFLVQIVKNSSYAVVIGFFDLTYSARVVNNSTFEPFAVFTIAALLYFAICYPLSVLSYRLERRLRQK